MVRQGLYLQWSLLWKIHEVSLHAHDLIKDVADDQVQPRSGSATYSWKT
jgi:hypothetical protein